MSAPHFSVIGIDPSLTACGVAIIQEEDGERRREVFTFGRKGKKDETLRQRMSRINKLATEVESILISLSVTPSVIAIESPAFDQTSGSTHDRSGLWWTLVTILEQHYGIPVVEVGISKVKIYATGKGTGRKAEVMAAAIRRYLDVPIANDNEADAWVLASMAARLVGEPIEESLPQTHLRAMDGLVLP